MTKYYNKEEIPDQKHFLNETSEQMLEEIQPSLANIVRRAVAISDIEIQVTHGMRTLTQQHEFFRKGISIGNQSPHMYGYAVDLVPIVEGRLSFEPEIFDDVAYCMLFAARDLNTAIRWGGAWHCDNLANFTGVLGDLQIEYIDTMRLGNKRPRIDVQHFELSVAE